LRGGKYILMLSLWFQCVLNYEYMSYIVKVKFFWTAPLSFGSLNIRLALVGIHLDLSQDLGLCGTLFMQRLWLSYLLLRIWWECCPRFCLNINTEDWVQMKPRLTPQSAEITCLYFSSAWLVSMTFHITINLTCRVVQSILSSSNTVEFRH